MILTIFLAIVFCVAITLMMFAAVAFTQDKKFFSSVPKEARNHFALLSFFMVPATIMSPKMNEAMSAVG